MKQIGIIIILLLLVGGVYMLVSNGTDVDPTETDTATSTDEVATSSTDDELATTTISDDGNISYCDELKSNIEGSADWTIITGITDGTLLPPEGELSGCVYSVNGSYGGWAPFEGQIGYYEILADDGTSLAQGPLSTMGDWMDLAMSGESIQYTAALDFDSAGYSNGTLIFHNENAAGMPEMDQTVEIDVVFE